MAREISIPQIRPPQPRIEQSTMELMIMTAFFFDVLQALISATIVGFVFSPIVTVFAWLTFWVWLKTHDITLMDNVARMVILWSGFLIELVPGFNIIPAWTLSVFLSLALIHLGDRHTLEEFHSKVRVLSKKFS